MKFIYSIQRFLLLFVFLLLFTNTIAINYYQRQSGAWNNPTTWTTVSSWNSTVNTGTYPKAGDNVYIANNGNFAEIILTENAVCQNLYFSGSDPEGGRIIQGDFNIVVLGEMQLDYSVRTIIVQDNGYLQINSGITKFQTAKTIKNLRIGSESFVFNRTNDIQLTVSHNYDFFCYQSSVPTGINANAATKHNATPCNPMIVINSSSLDFGDLCVNSISISKALDFIVLAALASDITVGPSPGFTFSTTENGTYQPTLNISHSGGSFIQRIFVRFVPNSIATYNQSVAISGGGAAIQNFAVSGNAVNNVSPTLSNVKALQIYANAATLEAEVTASGCDNSPILERGFVYSNITGFSTNFAARQGEQGTFEPGSFSAKIIGLNTNTTYYYRAYATNAQGTTYSPEYSFNNQAYTYYTRMSGNWTNRDVWSTVACGENVNAGNYPLAKDNVVLCQQHIITVNTTGLACKNLDMNAFQSRLTLQHDFQVAGNLLVSNQSKVVVGTNQLHVVGNFTNLPNVWNAGVEYSSGTIIIDGNIHVGQSGTAPFNTTNGGLLIFNGSTFTTVGDVTVTNLQQSAASFVHNGTGNLSISGTFNQNNGSLPIGNFLLTNGGVAINTPTVIYRTIGSGDFSNSSVWQMSSNSGSTWQNASVAPSSGVGVVRVIGSHTLSLNQNAVLKSMTVDAGATLNINPATHLKLENGFVNNGTVRLLSDVNGTAVLIPAADYNGTGNFVVQQYLPEVRNWYMSSPLPNATSTTAATATFVYRENGDNAGAIAPESAYWKSISNLSTQHPMNGFVFVPSSNGVTEFSSNALNVSSNTIALSRTVGKQKEGFNLIGNPFTAPLNVQSTLLSNPNIESSIWYRTRNGSSYVFATVNLSSGISTYDASTLVPAMQAFWVRVINTPTTSITFSPENLVETSTPLKVRKQNANILRLRILGNKNVDETVLYFDDRASDDFDKFDSRKEFNNNKQLPEIYSTVNAQSLAINGLNAAYDGLTIPVGISILKEGDYSILINETPEIEGLKVVLKDALNATEVELNNSQSYNFNSEIYKGDSRFSLMFRAKDVATKEFKSNRIEKLAKVFVNEKSINIEIFEQAEIRIFNMSGQMVFAERTQNSTVKTPSFKEGIYLVKLKNWQYEQITRVVLK